MAERQSEQKPKSTIRNLCKLVSRFTRYLRGNWAEAFCLAICFPLLVFAFLSVFIITLVSGTIEACRFYCPRHRERFQYEIIPVPTRETSAGSRQTRIVKRDKTTDYIGYEIEQARFPYANDSPVHSTNGNSYRCRYCATCRARKADFAAALRREREQRQREERIRKEADERVWLQQMVERPDIVAAALRELDEMERCLGLAPECTEGVRRKDGEPEGSSGDL